MCDFVVVDTHYISRNSLEAGLVIIGRSDNRISCQSKEFQRSVDLKHDIRTTLFSAGRYQSGKNNGVQIRRSRVRCPQKS